MQAIKSYSNIQNNNINSKNNVKFKGYYTSKNFYKLEKQLAKNPNIIKKDIQTIRDSIEAYEALNRSIQKGKLSADQISDQMMKKYGIPTEFHGDTFLAASAALASNIMQKLGLIQPNSVSKVPLRPNIAGSCTIFTRDILLNAGTNWAKDAQDIAIKEKLINFTSQAISCLHLFMNICIVYI